MCFALGVDFLHQSPLIKSRGKYMKDTTDPFLKVLVQYRDASYTILDNMKKNKL
jgi:hypothetical protein